MKQANLFGAEFETSSEDNIYTSKIKGPLYEPKHKQPHVLELFDNLKANRLINEIENSSVTEYEKTFLKEAAKRHIVFNYQKIADYYAHSGKEMQLLMEKSALIIIDFDRAIEYGYGRLSQEIANQFYDDFGDTKNAE